MDGREQLIVGCVKCQAVRVLDLIAEEVTSSIQSDVATGWHGMYPGGSGRLFLNLDTDGIVELEIPTSIFSNTIRRSQPSAILSSLCYIPQPHNLVIWGSERESMIKAVRYGTDRQVWKVTELLGVKCLPQGMDYSAQNDVILVAEGSNNRLLALHPSDGRLITAILFPEQTRDVHVLNDKVLIIAQNKINCYSMETIATSPLPVEENERLIE